MRLTPSPVLAPLASYDDQAKQLLAEHGRANPEALALLNRTLPRFLDPVVTWKPLELDPSEIAAASLSLDDTRLAVARGYSFRDWEALATHVAAVTTPGSPVRAFELAAEAVVDGDLAALDRLLTDHPDLVRARSERITCHDPAVHGATLVHYLGANGIEGYRQRSPANAVEIARRLFAAGAEADALAGMYGGRCPTLSMLVSSTPPAEAGVQVPLVHVLVDHGASVDGAGDGPWRSPLLTALVFGFLDSALALEQRGAAVDRLMLAAGLGRPTLVEQLLPGADAAERQRALALAAQLGHTETTAMLLDAGESPDRLNPDGFHSHATPLHQAALAGHLGTVQLMVDRGARLDIRDTLWDGTPLGWALHGGQAEVATLLRAAGAPE